MLFFITSPTGATFGSFHERKQAEDYAQAIRDTRGVICDIEERLKKEN